ncbi:hypothetical protein BJX99DRAFT_227080 [Aspergillus californicus]
MHEVGPFSTIDHDEMNYLGLIILALVFRAEDDCNDLGKPPQDPFAMGKGKGRKG